MHDWFRHVFHYYFLHKFPWIHSDRLSNVRRRSMKLNPIQRNYLNVHQEEWTIVRKAQYAIEGVYSAVVIDKKNAISYERYNRKSNRSSTKTDCQIDRQINKSIVKESNNRQWERECRTTIVTMTIEMANVIDKEW